jgi:alpha-beta hydrolase superfamily lysophospholipase
MIMKTVAGVQSPPTISLRKVNITLKKNTVVLYINLTIRRTIASVARIGHTMDAPTETAEAFNKPKTANYFRNTRGNRLHFRHNCNNLDACLGSIFFLHGYAGHVNGPGIGGMIKYMNDRNIAVFCMDFAGHGYSEGERALIEEREHLIEDFLGFINFILKAEVTPQMDTAGFDEHFDISQLSRIRALPFSVMGSSMGGAVTALVSNALTEFPAYCGSILLAPALSINPPHWLLVEFMRYTFCTVTPAGILPSVMASVTDNRHSLKHDESLLKAELDTWGLPGALGWNKGLRWGTALMFIDMAYHIGEPETLKSFRFPFLIIHDPSDKICSIEGSKSMIERSSTPAEDKKLVEVNS